MRNQSDSATSSGATLRWCLPRSQECRLSKCFNSCIVQSLQRRAVEYIARNTQRTPAQGFDLRGRLFHFLYSACAGHHVCPAFARPRAMAWPSPVVPPMTTATLPVKSKRFWLIFETFCGLRATQLAWRIEIHDFTSEKSSWGTRGYLHILYVSRTRKVQLDSTRNHWETKQIRQINYLGWTKPRLCVYKVGPRTKFWVEA